MQEHREQTVSPTTTTEENLHTASQRRTNLIWEFTQSLLALIVIATAMVIDAMVVVRGRELSSNQLAALMQLNVMAGIVIGFYFGRTNHQRVGGIQLGR